MRKLLRQAFLLSRTTINLVRRRTAEGVGGVVVAVEQDVLVVERYLSSAATTAMAEDCLGLRTVTKATWRWRRRTPMEELVDFLAETAMKMMAREWTSQKVREAAHTRVGLLAMTRAETTGGKALLDGCSERPGLVVYQLLERQCRTCMDTVSSRLVYSPLAA